MRLELRRKLWPYRSLAELAETLGVSLAVLKRRLRELQAEGNLTLDSLARSCGRTMQELDRAFLYREALPRASVQAPNPDSPSSPPVGDDDFFESERPKPPASEFDVAIESGVKPPNGISQRSTSCLSTQPPTEGFYLTFHARNLCLVCGNKLHRDTESKVGWGEFLVCEFCGFSVHENADFERMLAMAQDYLPAQAPRVVAERSRRRSQLDSPTE